MLPDILGYNLEIGTLLLKEYGVKIEDIIICDYMSPKKDIIGNDKRILGINEISGKIVLTVSNF